MTDISTDFYKVLGVKRGADQNTIRRAYRQLARQYHPDLNPSAADRFKEITAAYDTLGDETKRALYDEFGEVCLKPGFDPVVARHAGLGRGAPSGGGGGGGGGGFGSFEEFFGHLGGSSAGTRPYQGSDRGPDPEPEPASGSTNSGTRPYQGSPDPGSSWGDSSSGSASGTRPYQGSPGERVEPGAYGSGFEGSASGTRPYQGSARQGSRQGWQDKGGYRPGKHYGNGRGTNTPPQPSPYNSRQTATRQGSPTSRQSPPTSRQAADRSFTARPPPTSTQRERLYSSTPMPTRGENIALTVAISLMESLRGGTREVTVERTNADGRRGVEHLRISLKAGVSNGEQVELRGKGHVGRHGGHSGDLTITIAVESSPHFRREGYDLFIDVPVTLQEAILGGSIEVPTPDGPVRVRAPGGSTNGRRLRLRGRGVSVGNGERGDLYLILRPTPPSSTDPEVIRMIAELEKYYPREGVRADLKL